MGDVNAPRSIWPVIIASTLGVLILCGLGAWQLQRLAQKQALLTEIDRRGTADPVDLPEALRLHGNGENIEFMKVAVKGRFLHDSEKHLIAVFDGNPAWEVVTPLLTDDNFLVLVSRGLVPDNMRDPIRRAENNPAGEVEVTGILRTHGEGRGAFSPDNDIKASMWFWWDVPAMLESTPLPQPARTAPFVLYVDPSGGDEGFPRPVAIKASLRNNHLQYAVTWFALALALALIAGLFIRGETRKSRA